MLGRYYLQFMSTPVVFLYRTCIRYTVQSTVYFTLIIYIGREKSTCSLENRMGMLNRLLNFKPKIEQTNERSLRAGLFV